MIVRTFLVLIGLAIIAVVVYLGYMTVSNPGLVPWFGIVSAVLAPAGFALIGLAIYSRDRLALRRLEKVPEIQDLIRRASSQEEKLKALQNERAELLQVIEYEAQTKALESRRQTLEDDAVRILNQLDSTVSSLSALERNMEVTSLSPELEALRERIHGKQRGDIVIRLFDTDLVIPRKALETNPFFGYFELIELIMFSIKQKLQLSRSRK